MPKGAGYNSAKAGLNHFARMVAFEEASKGIRVNVVSPGCTRVEMFMSLSGMDPNSKKE